WTYEPDTLIYVQDKDGDENFHVYSVNVKDETVTDLTKDHDGRAMLAGTHRKHPDELLVAMNKRSKEAFDVYRINLKTGKAELDTKNPGNVIGWGTDNDFEVRIAITLTGEGGREIKHRKDRKSEWETLVEWGPEDAEGNVVGFTKDNKSVYLLTSEKRNTLALVRRDLASGKETLIA